MTNYDYALSLGFDAGNYAAAYETTDYDTALARLSRDRTEAYIAAFTLGFFSSAYLNEMGQHRETYLEAYRSEYGQRCMQLGYIDALTEF